MKKISLLLVLFTLLFMSCKNSKEENNTMKTEEKTPTELSWIKIQPTEIPDNIIKLISKDWMLITAGTNKSFNTMTASWGFLGEIWGKDASVILVRDTRYTHEFLQENETYTLTFFPEEYREALSYCGSVSGRDIDKVKESGLTPKELESGSMCFEEANLIIECKKMYAQSLLHESFTNKSILENIYGSEESSMHTMFIGEIVNVWIKK